MKYKDKKIHNNSLAIKKGRNKKPLTIALVILIIAAIGGLVFFIQQDKQKSNDTSRDDSAQTDSAKKEASKNNDDESSENGTDGNSSTNTNAPQQNVDAPPAPSSSSPSVTMAGFSQQNGQVNTSVSLTGAKSTSTCNFTFSHRDAKPVAKQVQSDGKACSVSIPEVEFSIIGLWQLNVASYNGSSKLAETNQNVTIY